MLNTQPCLSVASLTARVLHDKSIVVTDPTPKPLLFDGLGKDAVSQRIFAVRDVDYVSLRTSPYEQACALHSTFGTIHNTELFCENARQKAKDICFTHTSGVGEMHTAAKQRLLTMIWSELAVPAAKAVARGHRFLDLKPRLFGRSSRRQYAMASYRMWLHGKFQRLM